MGIGVPDGSNVAPIPANSRQVDGSLMTGYYSNPSQFKMQNGSVTGPTNKLQIFADLSSVTGVDINTVRQAFALQRFEEARARYGSRYTEYLRYLGVRSSDARLQRPEYLGGGRQTIQFSEVLQTSATSGSNPLGDLGGHGITAMRSNRFRRFFEEHGIVMTLMSVRPRTIYANPVARQFMRGLALAGMSGTKEDYWQRELQHIGQQEVNGLEVDVSAGNTSFGFQDRYDEYRRLESSVAGQFRTTLADWILLGCLVLLLPSTQRLCSVSRLPVSLLMKRMITCM